MADNTVLIEGYQTKQQENSMNMISKLNDDNLFTKTYKFNKWEKDEYDSCVSHLQNFVNKECNIKKLMIFTKVNANIIGIDDDANQANMIIIYTRKNMKYNLKDMISQNQDNIVNYILKPNIFHKFLITLINEIIKFYSNTVYSREILVDDIWLNTFDDICIIDNYINKVCDITHNLIPQQSNKSIQSIRNNFRKFLTSLKELLETKYSKEFNELYIIDRLLLYRIHDLIRLTNLEDFNVLNLLDGHIDHEYQLKIFRLYNLEHILKNDYDKLYIKDIYKDRLIMSYQIKMNNQDALNIIKKLNELAFMKTFIDFFIYFSDGPVNIIFFFIDLDSIFTDNHNNNNSAVSLKDKKTKTELALGIIAYVAYLLYFKYITMKDIFSDNFNISKMQYILKNCGYAGGRILPKTQEDYIRNELNFLKDQLRKYFSREAELFNYIADYVDHYDSVILDKNSKSGDIEVIDRFLNDIESFIEYTFEKVSKPFGKDFEGIIERLVNTYWCSNLMKSIMMKWIYKEHIVIIYDNDIEHAQQDHIANGNLTDFNNLKKIHIQCSNHKLPERKYKTKRDLRNYSKGDNNNNNLNETINSNSIDSTVSTIEVSKEIEDQSVLSNSEILKTDKEKPKSSSITQNTQKTDKISNSSTEESCKSKSGKLIRFLADEEQQVSTNQLVEQENNNESYLDKRSNTNVNDSSDANIQALMKLANESNGISLLKLIREYRKYQDNKFKDIYDELIKASPRKTFYESNGSFKTYILDDKNWITYTKEMLYVGQLVNGNKEGNGKIFYSDGQSYEGEFQHNKCHGTGILINYNGNVRYNGQWENGEYHGDGILTLDGGQYYEGQFQNGKFHGKGKILSSEKVTVLVGTWINGLKHGEFEAYSLFNFTKRKVIFQNDREIESKIIPKKRSGIKIIECDDDNKNTTITPQGVSNTRINNISIISTEEIKQVPVQKSEQNNDTICKYGVLITETEISRLNPGQWLNSKNIRCYMRFLNELHNNEYWSLNILSNTFTDFKHIFYYPDDFLTILTMGTLTSYEDKWNYNSISYVTRQYNHEGYLVFDFFDRLLFVVNRSNSHWFLVEINCESLTKFRFILYDSLISRREQGKYLKNQNTLMSILVKYCESEIYDKCCSKHNGNHNCRYLKLLENAEYEIYSSPQQKNFSDCGVFTCGFLRDITFQKSKLEFSQSEANELRKLMRNQYYE